MGQNNQDLLSSYDFSMWKTLLHYKGKKSVIGQESAFFISPNGNQNAKAELDATIMALKTDSKTQCKYPARLDFYLKLV
jgi:hypothetical protein